jgi:DNA-directed RNA polymerase subunit RPC12/RpoP
MLVHTGEKKHKCSICGKAFGLKHNLTSHEKIHKGRGSFCRYCGKMFTQVRERTLRLRRPTLRVSMHCAQSKNLREHESQHANLGHRVTQDRKEQGRQKLAESKRGRKSIQELDRKRKGAKGQPTSSGFRGGEVENIFEISAIVYFLVKNIFIKIVFFVCY